MIPFIYESFLEEGFTSHLKKHGKKYLLGAGALAAAGGVAAYRQHQIGKEMKGRVKSAKTAFSKAVSNNPQPTSTPPNRKDKASQIIAQKQNAKTVKKMSNGQIRSALKAGAESNITDIIGSLFNE